MYYRVLVHEGKVVSSLIPRLQPPTEGSGAFQQHSRASFNIDSLAGHVS